MSCGPERRRVVAKGEEEKEEVDVVVGELDFRRGGNRTQVGFSHVPSASLTKVAGNA